MNPSEQEKATPLNSQGRPFYDREPDYTRPILKVSPKGKRRLYKRLRLLYGSEQAEKWLPELLRVIRVHHAHKSGPLQEFEARHRGDDIFTERDMILITYADMIDSDRGKPLQVLAKVCHQHVKAPNTLHILPFFPYSSDRGFSVIDFLQVDPRLGDWDDILEMSSNFKLMFDGVLNHMSSHSKVFKDFLDGHPYCQSYFIHYDSPDELTADQRSKIFRPRTSDILTRFETINGPKYVWTTFSQDQIDLNYRNPEVLVFVTECLLFYVRQGANLLRLDAVTYIWAEPGTECVHLAETHEVVKLLRDVMEIAAPGVAIITETNVPHNDNVSYFGSGRDEAHMVYNFALPPLVLYTMYTENAEALSNWATGLAAPSEHAYFFNILDTHDGIGLMGVKGILGPEQIELIIKHAKDNGALVSYKAVAGGGQEPYEINSTWWSALNHPNSSDSLRLQAKRLAASRSIAMALKGVPGMYIHGVLGTENDMETYRKTLQARDVNRAYIDMHALEQEDLEPDSKLANLERYLVPLNQSRVREKSFHPRGAQKVLNLSPQVFALLRTSPDGEERILALTNVSSETAKVHVQASDLGGGSGSWLELIREQSYQAGENGLELELAPYQVAWLRNRR